jgi:hypothetical protein
MTQRYSACRIALSTYGAHEAGVYGEVQNLGGLAARLVFWPVETAAFRTFSKRTDAETIPCKVPSNRGFGRSAGHKGMCLNLSWTLHLGSVNVFFDVLGMRICSIGPMWGWVKRSWYGVVMAFIEAALLFVPQSEQGNTMEPAHMIKCYTK